MTELELEAISKRAEKATPGPWRFRDAEFIAHARTDVPALVSALRDAEWAITNLNEQMNAMRDAFRNSLAEANAEIRNLKLRTSNKTFIPDPDALTVGDTVYLTKEHGCDHDR